MDYQVAHLVVSPSPHVRDNITTRRVMGCVCIALLPALIASVIIFGFRSLLVVLVTVISCVLCEFLWCLLRKQEQTVGDLSAVVTGLLLAYNMPVSVPLYLPVIGSIASIIIAKELFGGIGHNFANPAIVGRITLAVSFPALMTNYTYPTPVVACDAISSATPMAVSEHIPLLNLFLGTHGGALGETCVLALLIGLIILLATRTIEITIPLVYIATMALGSLVLGYNVAEELLSGGLLLGAIFMATDYTTSPFSRRGKIIYAFGLGVLTWLIRYFGNMNEGVSYAILLMNLVVPLINAKTRKVPIGGEKQK